MESSFLHPDRALAALQLHEGMLVADFAAGAGFFTRAAARAIAPDGVVWAVDANREMLPRIKNIAAAEGLTNIEVVHGNIEVEGGTKLPPEHFDAVLLVNALFSADAKPAVVKELKRVLKRSGRALVVDWRGSFGGLGPHESQVVSEASARKLFEVGGFSVGESVPAGEYHWGFIVRKKSK